MTEDGRESHPPYRPPPRELVALAAVLALVEIVLELSDHGLIGTGLRARVFAVGAFWAQLLHGARPIFDLQPVTMFVSHAFLHGGFLHMAMNCVVLLGLGRLVSDLYGSRAILPVFLAGAVAGGAVFGLLATSPYPMVGASGAIFAFVGVWVVGDWRRLRAAGRPVRPVLSRVFGFVLLNVIFFVALSGMLAWEAHLGGFLAGLVAGVLLENCRERKLEARLAEARTAARARREGRSP
ncbi:rhomboid family intramembrane serine protease [Amaricoccus sp.]|uniref:rhomboid family intramembrane serine protease n=1 Tax=Amaricoccus sp. TaxID=1872485 RepID=UPI001B73523D|nr:rhomboid family intramembrane serine protease [Amaricoccus sp.]MBP7242080.1 rhomboid family intramembrane serine protease [Amaricoccus sp.]